MATILLPLHSLVQVSLPLNHLLNRLYTHSFLISIRLLLFIIIIIMKPYSTQTPPRPASIQILCPLLQWLMLKHHHHPTPLKSLDGSREKIWDIWSCGQLATFCFSGSRTFSKRLIPSLFCLHYPFSYLYTSRFTLGCEFTASILRNLLENFWLESSRAEYGGVQSSPSPA